MAIDGWAVMAIFDKGPKRERDRMSLPNTGETTSRWDFDGGRRNVWDLLLVACPALEQTDRFFETAKKKDRA